MPSAGSGRIPGGPRLRGQQTQERTDTAKHGVGGGQPAPLGKRSLQRACLLEAAEVNRSLPGARWGIACVKAHGATASRRPQGCGQRRGHQARSQPRPAPHGPFSCSFFLPGPLSSWPGCLCEDRET